MGNILKFPSKSETDSSNAITFHKGEAIQNLLREIQSKTETTIPENKKPIRNNILTRASILEEEVIDWVPKRYDIMEVERRTNTTDTWTDVDVDGGGRRCGIRIPMEEQFSYKARKAISDEYDKIRKELPSLPAVRFFHDSRGFMEINVSFNSSDYFGADKLKSIIEKLANLAQETILK